MPVTGSDITGNADLFKAAYPSWPHAETGAGLVWPGDPVADAAGAWQEDPFWRCAVHNVPLAYDQDASDANDQDRWSCPEPECTQGRWV
jgi:hypothetical protein